MKELNWWGAYSDSLKGKIVDEAFSHPAKMAWGLTMRIFQHLFDEGWLKEGELVADPFGGIGVTALAAASFGCPCIVVELEEKFCKLAEENFELHREQWERMGKPHPIILQGDSRNFSSIIREAMAIVTSPPYMEGIAVQAKDYSKYDKLVLSRQPWNWAGAKNYGDAEGQIGAMKEGKLDEVVAVITSPPYAESLQPETEEQTRRKQERIAKAKTIHNGRALEKPSPGKAALGGGYGVSEGQLGAMKEGDFEGVVNGVITSPPYSEAKAHPSIGAVDENWGKAGSDILKQRGLSVDYGKAEGQLGIMPEGNHEAVVNGIVTSPPYERSMDSSENAEARAERADGFAQGMKTLKYGENPYRFLSKDPSGLSNEERHRLAAQNPQIGQKRGDTYWEAVSGVYQECLKTLRPGGVMAVVVKSFVRNKKIVDLPSQTLELLEAIGFEPLERIRAWMVSPVTQASMMPDVVPPYRKEKKSFFRRLAEKRGSPRIDWEEVLVLQKPH